MADSVELDRKVVMHYRPFGSALLICAVLLGSACIFEPVDLGEHDDYRAELDLVWETFDQSYIGFIFVSVDWDAVYAEYSTRVDTVSSQMGMINLFLDMLACMQDGHLFFYNIVGTAYYPYMPQIELNYDMDVLWTYLDPAGFEWFQYDLWGYCMFDLVPYVMITAWDPWMIEAYLDDMLEAHPDAPAIIFDVRMNPGGQPSPTREIARRFNDEKRVGFFMVYRDGPEHDDLSEPEPYYVYPRQNSFQKPVAILIGNRCASANESFICIMSDLPQVVLLGDTTMGQVNAPQVQYSLPGGWKYTVPSWTTLKADTTTWVQGIGIPPDIYIEATVEEFQAGIDPVLEYALVWANEQ